MATDNSNEAFEDSQNITFEEASQFIAQATKDYEAADVESIVSTYASDVTIVYADFPVMHGKEEARDWLTRRFRRQKNYTLDKRAVSVMNNIIGATWEGRWSDAETDKNMECRASEFLTIEDGLVAHWYATMSVWEVDRGASTPLV